MNGLRLALITRRFWPLVGGAEMVMANLATEFQRLGHRPTILTACWEPHWPRELVHRDVPVIRLPNPPQRGWGTVRYMTSLWRWLRKHHEELDGVLVSMLKHSAYTSVTALQGHRLPIVVRAEGGGESGDCRWHQQARFGSRIKRRCERATALVAPSDAIADELRQAGFAAGLVHTICNGVRIPELRDVEEKQAIRAALAEVNYDLTARPDAPVVVFTGRLHPAKGLAELVSAWPAVMRQFPEARLWIVGDGPFRDELFELILDLELRGKVLLPGSFDEVEDILQAADLFVLPSYEEGMSLSLLEAMAAGLPLVATDIPGNRKLVTHQQHGLLVPPRDVQALALAMIQQLQQRILARAYAAAARARVENEFSLRRMAEAHLELLAGLSSSKRVEAG